MWIIANHHWSVASSIWESKAWTPPETLLVISSAPSPERIRPRELTNNFLKKTPSPPQLHRQQSSPWFSCWPSHELSADSITSPQRKPIPSLAATATTHRSDLTTTPTIGKPTRSLLHTCHQCKPSCPVPRHHPSSLPSTGGAQAPPPSYPNSKLGLKW